MPTATRQLLLQQLALATRQDIAPRDVAHTLAQDPQLPKADQRCLTDLAERLAQGQTLAQALDLPRLGWAPETLAWLTLADTRGQLPAALTALAQDMALGQHSAHSVRTALIWPAALGVGICLLYTLASSVVIPAFRDLSVSLRAPLPSLTQTIFGASDMLTLLCWALLTVAIFLGWALATQRLPMALRRPLQNSLMALGFVRRERQSQFTLRLLHLLRAQQHETPLLAAALSHLAATTHNSTLAAVGTQLQSALAHTPAPTQPLQAMGPVLRAQHGPLHRLGLWLQLAEKMRDSNPALAEWGEEAQRQHGQDLARLERGVILIAYAFIGLLLGTLMLAIYQPIFQLGQLV